MLPLVLALFLFYFLHSWLASPTVKNWARSKWGLVKGYRLFYSAVSVITLLIVIWLLIRSPGVPLLKFSLAVQLIGLVIFLLGLALSFFSIVRFGLASFIGIRAEDNSRLVRSGIHGYIRHPIYTGIILASLGWFVLSPTLPVLITILFTFLYLPIGIHLEERKLIGQFGEEYIRYRNEVPGLLPTTILKSRSKHTS